MNPLGAAPGTAWHVSVDHADMVRKGPEPRPTPVEAMPKPITIDLARTAMIVVDMQNDFCHPEGWLAGIGVDVAAARTPIDPLNAMLPVLRTAGIPVIWVNWGNRPDLKNISPALRHVYNGSGDAVGLGDPLPGSGAKVLTEGSWSAQVVDELDIMPEDVRVSKFRMSGFWDTPLDSILRNLGVTTVLFGGVNADQCVLHTLADANFLGYDTVMVEDVTATTSPDFCWQATLYNVRQIFGFSCMSDALITGIRGGHG